MKLNNNLIVLLFVTFPILLNAQAELIFNGIQLNESYETVSENLSEIAETSKTIVVDNPSFPLAKTKEEHLVCSKIKTENGMVDRAVFTFADDKLVYIEARGNVLKTLTSQRNDTARTYMDYKVYVKDKLFLNYKKDAAWMMTEEAMHTNLFAWKNPYLNNEKITVIKTKSTNKTPSFLKMGASFKELKPLLEANSSFTNREELDGSDPNAQFQVNCFGVDYLGFPRKIEARFGNNKLNVVWILTAKGEEDRIRKALIAEYGDPIFVNEDWEIFNNWQVGLRKDKPEVILLEQQIGLDYKTSYFKQ